MTFNFLHEQPSESNPDEVIAQVFTWLIKCEAVTSFNKLQAGIATALFEDKFGNGTWVKLKVRFSLFLLMHIQ
jgi:hypothetical protein